MYILYKFNAKIMSSHTLWKYSLNSKVVYGHNVYFIFINELALKNPFCFLKLSNAVLRYQKQLLKVTFMFKTLSKSLLRSYEQLCSYMISYEQISMLSKISKSALYNVHTNHILYNYSSSNNYWYHQILFRYQNWWKSIGISK